MAKRKSTKEQTTIYKTYIKTKDRVTRTPLKTGGELMCSGRVSSSCSTSDTRRVNFVIHPVISREWGQDREVFTTSGTYPWSFVTQIFHNGQQSHGGDRKIFEVTTLTLPKGILGSVAFLLAATLYQGNPDRNHKLWNIVSSERYILHMQVLEECFLNIFYCSIRNNWIGHKFHNLETSSPIHTWINTKWTYIIFHIKGKLRKKIFFYMFFLMYKYGCIYVY
jgi:hypothetical protein